MKNLFKREIFYLDNKIETELKKIININNINSWTIKQTYKLFGIYGVEVVKEYFWKLLHRWILINQRFTYDFQYSFEYILKIFCLNNELNNNELRFIDYFNNIIFAKHRNLKNIIIDFDYIDKTEEIYYKYNLFSLIQIISTDQHYNSYNDAEILLGNKRIIFSSRDCFCYINFDDINAINLKKYYLEIKLKNDHLFYVFSVDLDLIYISIERILKMINKVLMC